MHIGHYGGYPWASTHDWTQDYKHNLSCALQENKHQCTELQAQQLFSKTPGWYHWVLSPQTLTMISNHIRIRCSNPVKHCKIQWLPCSYNMWCTNAWSAHEDCINGGANADSNQMGNSQVCACSRCNCPVLWGSKRISQWTGPHFWLEWCQQSQSCWHTTQAGPVILNPCPKWFLEKNGKQIHYQNSTQWCN